MRHTRSLILLALFITLAACTPAPSVPPTSTPEPTFTPYPTETPTPEPTQIPKPAGWEEDWVEVKGQWLSPEMAAYVEKHNGMVEEIDGVTYFTTTVTVTIDGQPQEVKVKLLEQAESREMIPCYETLRELLAEEKIRQVLELSRMENAKDALFAVRPKGEAYQEDILRLHQVVEDFVSQTRTVRRDEEVGGLFPGIGHPSSGSDANFRAERDSNFDSLRPQILYNTQIMAPRNALQIDTMMDGVNLNKPRVLLFAGVLGSDCVLGFVPERSGTMMVFGIDQGLFEKTALLPVRNNPLQDSGETSFGPMVDRFLGLQDMSSVKTYMYIEIPDYHAQSFSVLPENIQKEWTEGPLRFVAGWSEEDYQFIVKMQLIPPGIEGMDEFKALIHGKVLLLSDYNIWDSGN
jgi:hypothetical protein